MTERSFERELAQLADSAFPESPSLVEGVLAAIAIEAPPLRRRGWMPAAAVAAAVIVAVLVLPAPRQALARLFGIGGVAIEQVDEYDLPASQLTDAPLGREVAFEDVADLVGFVPALPTVAGLPAPSAYVTDVAGGVVSLVYRNAGEDPGLVITQFRSRDGVAVKQLVGGASASEVIIVGDVRGYWIEGTHTIAFFDDSGEIRPDLARLVGDTLVWQEGDITFRLESVLGQEPAVDLAKSILRR